MLFNFTMSEWIASPKEYFLTSKIFYKDKKISYLKITADLNKGAVQNIEDDFLEKPILKIETRLDVIEPFSRRLIIKNKDYTLNRLDVGIRNSEGISYIGEGYNIPPSNSNFFQRFFFNSNHEPSGYESLGFGLGGKWPKLDETFITEDIKFYLNNLKEFQPKISENLEKCIAILEKHFIKPIIK